MKKKNIIITAAVAALVIASVSIGWYVDRVNRPEYIIKKFLSGQDVTRRSQGDEKYIDYLHFYKNGRVYGHDGEDFSTKGKWYIKDDELIINATLHDSKSYKSKYKAKFALVDVTKNTMKTQEINPYGGKKEIVYFEK